MMSMPYSEWVNFDKFTATEREYMIYVIMNQKGCSFQTDGVSYKTETHTKFIKFNTEFTNGYK
jgi:hypothetical protein